MSFARDYVLSKFFGKDSGGSGGGDLKALVARTLKEFKDNTVEEVGAYAFYKYDKLTSVDLPNCTKIGGWAFEGCTGLLTVNAPKVTTISSYSAFSGCTKLTSVNFPLMTNLGEGAFGSCSNLKSANIPLANEIAAAFNNCTALTELNAPSVTTIGANGLRNCSSLTRLDLPSVTRIRSYAFVGCSSLDTLILRNTSGIVTLDINAFKYIEQTSKIAEGTGYVYVPSALVDGYKSATNWSDYASQIRAIEDYPDICGG